MLPYSVDGTYASGLGRLVNDAEAKNANCKIKKLVIHDRPHLAIYAKRNIEVNEELRYDYGVKDLPWRIQKGNMFTKRYRSFTSTEREGRKIEEWTFIIKTAFIQTLIHFERISQNLYTVQCASDHRPFRRGAFHPKNAEYKIFQTLKVRGFFANF